MGMSDAVSSLQFCPKNAHLAVGTNTGETQIWDVAKLKKIRVFQGH
jgi:WD40 repeat protein